MAKKPTYEELEKRIQEIQRSESEFNQAEKALRESEERYRSLFKNNHSIMLLIDSKSADIVDANPAAVSYYGWSHEEITQKKITDINTLSKEKTIQEMDQAKRKQRQYFFFRHRLSNGEIRDVEVCSGPIAVNGRHLLYSIIHDITERKQAEDALKFSRLQFQAVNDNINSFIYITDMRSNEILFMNNHMKGYYGENLIGHTCWKSIHENQDGPCDFCTNDKLIDGDGNPTEPYVWEFYNQKLEKWFELHDLAVPWVDGNLVRMGIATDITDRKQVELNQKKNNEILADKVKERTAELEDLNAALKVLLKKTGEDKKEIEEKIFANHELLISPFLQKLKRSLTNKEQQSLMDIVESNLKELLHPFSKKISDPMLNLTPTEIHVTAMIKQGLTNKEIAQIMNNSVRTITNHRDHIRKKLGLVNKKVNLQSFLSIL